MMLSLQEKLADNGGIVPTMKVHQAKDEIKDTSNDTLLSSAHYKKSPRTPRGVGFGQMGSIQPVVLLIRLLLLGSNPVSARYVLV